ISDDAAEAIKSITAELAQEVDIDKTYRTLGGSEIFKKRCTKSTATLLADAVRLSLYKTPGHRAAAARRLGQTGDARVLAFLHHRLPLEQNYKVRTTIAEALGRIGHESSIELLKERINVRGRYMSKESEAMIRGLGGIYSSQSKETLLDLLNSQGNTTRAVAIQALGGQDSTDLVERLTPYLTDRSRPVVRAGVLALAELGDEGKSAIRDKANAIIKRIGYDRPSKAAITKMLSIEGVASMKPLHQYFAKRIQKLEQNFKRHQRRGTVSYGWYWRRREARARQRYEEFLRFAGSHLKPPFDEDLVKVAEGIVRTCDIPAIQELARTIVMKAGRKRRLRDVLLEQSHLSSYV
ncbi:MAG: HEAT repeat domain-containing protein, partial [Candidatus Thorarchaeota archaeon]